MQSQLPLDMVWVSLNIYFSCGFLKNNNNNNNELWIPQAMERSPFCSHVQNIVLIGKNAFISYYQHKEGEKERALYRRVYLTHFV